MKLFSTYKIIQTILLNVLLQFTFLHNVSCVFKMTNVLCESYNKSLVTINQCRLRAINPLVVKMYLNLTFSQVEHKVDLNVALVKKANGYKPFPINSTFDVCAFLKKRNNPIGNLVFNLFQEFSNINHSCPYMNDQIIDGFYLKHERFPLPLPNGEYALNLTWYLRKVKTFVTNVFFTFHT